MSKTLKIRGLNNVPKFEVNHGDHIDSRQFIQTSGVQVLLVDDDGSEVDKTDEHFTVQTGPLENLTVSGNVEVPWQVTIGGRLVQEGTITAHIKVREDHPTLTDFNIKDEGYQQLVNKGIAIPKGYRKIPNLSWQIDIPDIEIESFAVHFVDKTGTIMTVDYSSQFAIEFKEGRFTANYTGGLVNFEGDKRAGVAYILTLHPPEEEVEVVEESIATIQSVDDGESLMNQKLDQMVLNLSGLLSGKKNKEEKEKVVKKEKRNTDKEKQKKSKKKKKTPLNTFLSFALTIGITVLIGLGSIWGVNQWRLNTLEGIQDEVELIETNQEEAYAILNKRTLSTEDIAQLDILLNENQAMINDMNRNNIFIAQKRNELAKHNNDLVSEAKVQFDRQIRGGNNE